MIFLEELNTHFQLQVTEALNCRNSAGSYKNNCVFVSTLEVVKMHKGQIGSAQRFNIVGVKLPSNSLYFATNDDELIKLTYAHEFGHALEQNYRDDLVFKKTLEICENLAPKYISIYAGKTNKLSVFSEAFAETFALFTVKPAVLHEISHELYSAINDFYASFL